MIVEFPHTEIWQRDIMDFYISNKNDKWIVTKSPRQCGKSFLAQFLLMYASLSNEYSVSMCVSPILSQSRKMYDDIVRNFYPVIKKNNGSTLEIITINNSKIIFKSAEQADNIRGNTIKNGGIVVVDEAAYIKDDVFYSIIVPTTNVYNSDIFIFSTPKLKQGFFFNLYMKGLNDDEKVKSFDWNVYDTSKYLSNEKLELYRQLMPKLAFKSEFLAEFIDGDGTVFSEFKNCIGEYKLDNKPIVVGIDWGTGTGNDYTVLTTAQINNDKINIYEQVAFNDKNAQDTIQYIKFYIDNLLKYNSDITVVVEKNSIGNVYQQLLCDTIDENVQMQLFNTTNKSKDKIVRQLQVLFEQNKIVIPNDDKLINELSAYECKINSNGLPIYNAPNGLNDDRVMSLCFAVNNLYIDII